MKVTILQLPSPLQLDLELAQRLQGTKGAVTSVWRCEVFPHIQDFAESDTVIVNEVALREMHIGHAPSASNYVWLNGLADKYSSDWCRLTSTREYHTRAGSAGGVFVGLSVYVCVRVCA